MKPWQLYMDIYPLNICVFLRYFYRLNFWKFMDGFSFPQIFYFNNFSNNIAILREPLIPFFPVIHLPRRKRKLPNHFHPFNVTIKTRAYLLICPINNRNQLEFSFNDLSLLFSTLIVDELTYIYKLHGWGNKVCTEDITQWHVWCEVRPVYDSFVSSSARVQYTIELLNRNQFESKLCLKPTDMSGAKISPILGFWDYS